MLFNFGESAIRPDLPDIVGTWTTVMNSADSSWNGPEQTLTSQLTLTTGKLKLSPHSFVVMERAQAGHEPI